MVFDVVVVVVYLWLLLSPGGALAVCEDDSPSSCPESCRCDRETVVCTGDNSITILELCNLGLFEVPVFEGEYNSLVTLKCFRDLSGNSITTLYDEVFTSDNFPVLAELNLRRNSIEIIEHMAFLLPSLVELDLSDNLLTVVDFLTQMLSLSYSLIFNLDDNPLACEELDVVLGFLCSNNVIQTDSDLFCTYEDGAASTLKEQLSFYCDYLYLADVESTGGGDGEGSNVAIIAGATVGGIVVVGVLVVGVIIALLLLFIYFKSCLHKSDCCKVDAKRTTSTTKDIDFSSSRHHPSEFERTRYVTSRHFAPPSLPPIPPPLDIPKPADAEEEIYAEINESPLTGTSVISSKDYEVGYILNVDSVPGKTGKNFGSRPVLPPISPGLIGKAGSNSEPSEPIPYSTVPISMAANHPPEPERKTPSSLELHQKKPLIMPRKSNGASASEEPYRYRPERSSPGAERIQGAEWDKINEARTILTQVRAGEAPKEGDYLKVVI